MPTLIKKIDALDPLTVRFTLDHADSTFLAALSMGFASIYPAEYADKLLKAGTPEKLNSQPIGTGPFIFGRFQKDATIRYKANPDYFAGKPAVDNLIFAITPDANVRLQRLRRDECQIALSPKPLDIDAAQKDADLKIEKTAAFMTAFVAINSQHPPLDKPEVRQAINLAFDKASYLKAVFEGTAEAANGPYPPNTWSYAKDLPGYPQDIAKAKQLLDRAGLKDGFKTTIWTRPSGSLLNPNPSLGAQLLQADLAKVGIQAEIRVIEWGELIRRAKAGEHDLLFMGWAGDNGDPDNFLTPQFSCAAVKSGTNFARYCDPALDKLISAGKTTSEQGVRSKLYQQAQAQIQQQALWLPLAHPTAFALTRKNVEGYQVSPFGRQDYSRSASSPDPCQGLACQPLHPPKFRHRQRVTLPHNDVVQHTHVHHLQRLLQHLGQFSISDAGLGAAGRMVVAQDQRRGVVVQRALHHLSRVDDGVVDGALKQLFETQHSMLGVEKQAAEYLVRLVAQQCLEVVAHGLRAFQHRIVAQAFSQMTARHLQYGLKLGELRRPQPQMLAEHRLPRLHQRPKAAKLRQQMARQVHGTFA